jgi:hypothetical protein
VNNVSLSPTELAALERLEDEVARGEAVRWDVPKMVRGIAVRDVEVVTYADQNDGSEKTKRVLTLRTAEGIFAIFEGPRKLTSRLFDGEQKGGGPLGPPRKGDLVLIQYKGEKVSSTTGRAFKDFDVTVSRTALEPSAQIGPDDDLDRIGF